MPFSRHVWEHLRNEKKQSTSASSQFLQTCEKLTAVKSRKHAWLTRLCRPMLSKNQSSWLSRLTSSWILAN